MRIFDEQGNIIENPDLTQGRLVPDYRPVIHRYIITQEEQGHYDVIAEYPNGGKDVAWKIDVPEVGHWATYDLNNKEIEFDGVIPDDAPHELEIAGVEEVMIYILNTGEEEPSKEYVTYDELAAAIREGVNSYGQ